MARGYVTVRGMKPLYRDLRAVDRGLPAELQSEIKEAVGPLVTTAKAIAPYRTGALRGSIKPAATQKAIAVRATKKRRGFLYPAVYEYGGALGRGYGPRAFLNPALDRHEETIVKSVARSISHFLERHDL